MKTSIAWIGLCASREKRKRNLVLIRRVRFRALLLFLSHTGVLLILAVWFLRDKDSAYQNYLDAVLLPKPLTARKEYYMLCKSLRQPQYVPVMLARRKMPG